MNTVSGVVTKMIRAGTVHTVLTTRTPGRHDEHDAGIVHTAPA